MRKFFIDLSCSKYWLAVLVALLAITGCHKQYVSREQAKLPYKVAGANDKKIMDMQARFNLEGVKTLSIGQDYMISIPSSFLFPNESPRLTWSSYALLNAVACYLKEFHKVSITVTAYSNKCVSAKRDHALTLARAREVGNYLWSQGVDSRFIFTQGLGSDKPIGGCIKKGDGSLNSRIEITFRDAVA